MRTTKGYNSYRGWIAIVRTLVLSMIFFSCNTAFDLDETPGKSQLASLPYESMTELEWAVTGTYNQLWRAFRMNAAFASAWSGDDITTGGCGCKITILEYDRRLIDAHNSAISGNWRSVHLAIRAANTVIRNAARTNLPDRVAQDQLVGEAYFIRAILFHYLTRNHGRIPLVLDNVPDYEIGLASQEEVYQQIESDLLKAEAMLPASSNLGATKPNSGSARAYLARLYLDWAGFPIKDNTRYLQAAESAKQVIDNAETHGFTLVEDMASLYTLAGSRNTESVFTLAHCEPCGMGNRKYGKLGMPGDFAGWQESFAEIRFFEDFPEGPRKEATFHTQVPIDANGKATSDVANAVSFRPWTSFRSDQNPIYRKIVGPFEDGTFGEFETSRGDYLMRYAEVLLIYAEASGRAGNVTPDAWEALNKVHRRAEGLPINIPDPSVDLSDQHGAIEELAFTEKKWELAGEFLRWFDLVRMERVEQALGGTARNPRVSIGTQFNPDGSTTPRPLTKPTVPIMGPLGTDHYFLPLPPDEVLLLPNLGG